MWLLSLYCFRDDKDYIRVFYSVMNSLSFPLSISFSLSMSVLFIYLIVPNQLFNDYYSLLFFVLIS